MSCLREVDTVARIGGDELAIILPATDESTGAAAVFEKVRAANAAPIRYEGRLIRTSVSIGASTYPRDTREIEELRRYADSAMYAANGVGGNGVRFYRARRTSR